MTRDERFMEEAILLARKAEALGEVPIGCVITKDDEIVGRGWNLRETEKSALAHAELMAIRDACRTLGGWRLWQCRLYVTLEPCPMCTGAIINARIPTVIYGAADPKAGSVSSVTNLFALPYNHRPEVIAGVLEEPCAQLLTAFFRNLRTRKKAEAQARKAAAEEIPEAAEREIRETGSTEPELCESTEKIDKKSFSGYDIELTESVLSATEK